jgi:hypothetical protein
MLAVGATLTFELGLFLFALMIACLSFITSYENLRSQAKGHHTVLDSNSIKLDQSESHRFISFSCLRLCSGCLRTSTTKRKNCTMTLAASALRLLTLPAWMIVLTNRDSSGLSDRRSFRRAVMIALTAIPTAMIRKAIPLPVGETGVISP